MLATLIALAVAAGLQLLPADRDRAEQLARAGQTADALALFERIVAENPDDADARSWLGRLELRAGRTADAEIEFRIVLRDHPADVDARIGLGIALTRRGAWKAALEVLRAAEADAGSNADFFAAIARAYRRAGDDEHALAYLRRARALAPGDPDLVDDYEAVARVYGHSIVFEGFGNNGGPSVAARFGSVTADVRVAPRLHLLATGRAQERSGADALAGGGFLWRVDRATTLDARAIAGHDNVSLPNSDLAANVIRYAGIFEMGAGVRRLSYAGTRVGAVSLVPAWDGGGPWRLDGRYTYSVSRFATVTQATGDNSVMIRGTWRGWRRAALNVIVAHGIERFETLTPDELGLLNMNTVAAGTRITLPSLSMLAAGWEHEMRSNHTSIDRLTMSIVQTFP